MGCGTFLGWVLKNITTSKNQHTQRKLFREIWMILEREIIWHFLTYCHWLYHWLYSKNMDCNFHKFPLITYVQPKILLFRNHCQFFFIKWFSKSFHDKNHSPRIFPLPKLKISHYVYYRFGWSDWCPITFDTTVEELANHRFVCFLSFSAYKFFFLQ